MTLAAAALAALLGWLVWQAPALLAGMLPNYLKSQGFKSVAVTVKSAGWTHLSLEDVALDKALSAKRLKIGFSPFGLKSLEARDLFLRGGIDGKRLELGPLSLPLASTGGGTGFAIPKIRIDQARFELMTPKGDLDGVFSSEPEGHSTRFRLDLTSVSKPALVSPMILTGILSEDGDALRFAGKLNDPSHRLVIHLKGMQDNAKQTGEAEVTLERAQFAEGGLQPQYLIPLLEPYLRDVSGSVEGEMKLAWSGGKLASQGRFSTPGLSFESKGARVRNLMGALELDRLWPPRTSSPQRFSFGQLTAGIPLGSGALAFSFENDGSLAIKRGVLNLADGKLRLNASRLSPELTGTLDIEASGVALSRLAPLFQVEGISLDGRIDGHIPLVLDKDGIKVAKAQLAAQNNGYVRYRPKIVPPALQDSGEGVSLMLAALKDFQYESLAMGLDGLAGGETTVEFHLKGRNPGLHDGKPFEFNFRLTGPLDSLARQAASIATPPESIEAALAEISR